MSAADLGTMLCVLMLAVWLGVRRDERRAMESACRHQWRIDSLYGEGRHWHRRCDRCGKQEIAEPPSHLRRPRSRRR